MTALVGVQCDGCETTLTTTTVSQASIGPVREEARAQGWRTQRGTFRVDGGTEIGYRQDFCPACTAAPATGSAP